MEGWAGAQRRRQNDVSAPLCGAFKITISGAISAPERQHRSIDKRRIRVRCTFPVSSSCALEHLRGGRWQEEPRGALAAQPCAAHRSSRPRDCLARSLHHRPRPDSLARVRLSSLPQCVSAQAQVVCQPVRTAARLWKSVLGEATIAREMQEHVKRCLALVHRHLHPALAIAAQSKAPRLGSLTLRARYTTLALR